MLIAGLLAGTLVLTAGLALQAFRSASQRLELARGALRDHATFASAEFVRRARESIDQNVVIGLLRPVVGVSGAESGAQLPLPSVLEAPGARAPAIDLRDSVRTWFRLTLADSVLVTARDTPSVAVAEWLRDSVPPHARDRMSSNAYSALLGGAPGEAPLAAAYILRYDAAGDLGVVYGAVLPQSALAPVMAAIHRGAPLLPRARTTLHNDSTLTVEVAGAGSVIFGSGEVDASLAATDTLGVAHGNLVARVAPRTEAAGQLVIGGLPAIPTVPLVGAMVLVAGLIGVAMLQLRREAELVRLREEFVAGVSHELRTPLAQIRLFAETLLLDRLRTPDERTRALRIVHDESRRLSQLVDNLLQFSRTGHSMHPPALDNVALMSLAHDVVAQYSPLADQRQVRLETDGPAVTARGDRDALRQVLLNLLDNAVRHGPDGQRVVVRTETEGARSRLVVDDEGPGIPEPDRVRVFERFSRVGNGRDRTGTGLGLAVVKELVERQHGRVAISSNERGGCRVTVDLPSGSAP